MHPREHRQSLLRPASGKSTYQRERERETASPTCMGNISRRKEVSVLAYPEIGGFGRLRRVTATFDPMRFHSHVLA